MSFPIVLAGVDGTRAGFEAARQAAALVDPDGRLLLVAVEDGWDALAGRWAGVRWARWDDEVDWTLEGKTNELRARIDASLQFAVEHVRTTAEVEADRVPGRSFETLVELASREGAALLAVGSHGGSRARGIVMGQTATTIAHRATCSVLIARPPFDPASFPGGVVVGYDGSPQSELALDVAADLAVRHPQAPVRVVTCRPVPPGLAIEAAAQRAPAHFAFEHERLLADDGLVEAAEAADLLVVGSRGLQGVRALGSTSERVAHRAASSVLIVR
jgi:nucleotide-binding universal stress UspA family protein